jgi:hypothetical protein
MFRQFSRPALALFAIVPFAPASWAACSQHTFDPCPEPRSGYKVEVDQKTGRTWIKEAKAPVADTSTLARLSATAKNVSPGALAKASANPRETTEWRTQVSDYRKPWPPLK